MRNASFDRFLCCVEGNVKLFKGFSLPQVGEFTGTKTRNPKRNLLQGATGKTQIIKTVPTSEH